MKDIEKIRAEIERLQLCTMDEHMNYYSPEAQGEYNALTKLESFIDSLSEDRNLDNSCNNRKNLQEESAAKYSFNIPSELFHQLTPEQQKLWKKEIEQAYDAGMKQKEEPASEDFNDEIRKYLLAYKGYPHVMDKTEWDIKKACIHFVNWQKQQMMKDAVKSEIDSSRSDGKCILSGNFYKYNPGDKVKLIIIKEE